MVKGIFLYVLALIVLLAPAIILGWIGWTLIEWPGLIIGIIAGLAIFIFSMNKIAAQEAAEQQGDSNGDETPSRPMEESIKHD